MRELLRMSPGDHSPSLLRILPCLTDAGHVRRLCLPQGTDEPLSTRLPVQSIAIFYIPSIAKAAEIRRRDREILAWINRPKKAFLKMRAKTIVVPDRGNQEPSASFGKRVHQRRKGNHRNIVHAKPSARKRHVVTGMEVKILEREPPGRSLTVLRIAVRKSALFDAIMLL